MRARFGTALVVAWSSICPIALGGEPPPAATFEGEVAVELVELRLWALDRERKAVDDLRIDELIATLGGEPIEIRSFVPLSKPKRATSSASPSSEAASSAAASAVEPGAERIESTLAIFYDSAHLEPAHRAGVERQLAEFLDGLPKQTAVLVFAWENDLQLVVPRTKSRRDVIAGIEALRFAGRQAFERRIESEQVVERIRRRQQLAIDNPLDPDCPPELLEMARQFADTEARTGMLALEALSRLSQALSILPGSRSILLVTDGLDLFPGLAAYETIGILCDGSGAAEGVEFAVERPGGAPSGGSLDPRAAALEAQSRSLANVGSRVASLASRAGIPIWTLDADGTGAPGSASNFGRTTTMGRQQLLDDNSRQLLFALADDTGGVAIDSPAQLAPALPRLAASMEGGYLLTIVRPRGRQGELRVTSARRGIELFHAKRPPSDQPLDLGALAAGALRFGLGQSELGARVALARGRSGRLRLRFELPVAELVWSRDEAGSEQAALEYAVGAESVGGAELPARLGRARLERAAGELEPKATIVREVELPRPDPGTRIAVAVRDPASGRTDLVLLVAP